MSLTRDDANDLAAKFRGLMPRMTDQQNIEVRDLLLLFWGDRERAWQLLRAYAGTHEEFMIAGVRQSLVKFVGNAARTQRELQHYRELAKVCEKDLQVIDQIIARADDATLAAARQVAVERMPEFFQRRCLGADPRRPEHVYLRSMIVSVLESGLVLVEVQSQSRG